MLTPSPSDNANIKAQFHKELYDRPYTVILRDIIMDSAVYKRNWSKLDDFSCGNDTEAKHFDYATENKLNLLGDACFEQSNFLAALVCYASINLHTVQAKKLFQENINEKVTFIAKILELNPAPACELKDYYVDADPVRATIKKYVTPVLSDMLRANNSITPFFISYRSTVSFPLNDYLLDHNDFLDILPLYRLLDNHDYCNSMFFLGKHCEKKDMLIEAIACYRLERYADSRSHDAIEKILNNMTRETLALKLKQFVETNHPKLKEVNNSDDQNKLEKLLHVLDGFARKRFFTDIELLKNIKETKLLFFNESGDSREKRKFKEIEYPVLKILKASMKPHLR